jgi:hypothetical protein
MDDGEIRRVAVEGFWPSDEMMMEASLSKCKGDGKGMHYWGVIQAQ